MFHTSGVVRILLYRAGVVHVLIHRAGVVQALFHRAVVVHVLFHRAGVLQLLFHRTGLSKFFLHRACLVCFKEFVLYINIDGEKLSDLRFADDVALTTENVKDMEHQLNTANEES